MEYTERELLYLLLNSSGVKHPEAFLERFETAEECLQAAGKQDGAYRDAASAAGEEVIMTQQGLKAAVEALEKKKIVFFTAESPGFPEKLRCADVKVLYCRGNAALLKKRSAAIVGTRGCSTYGAKCAAFFAGKFAASGVTVVSGLASGVDAAAHEGALDAGGGTIAVMGLGLDYVYPPENEGLMRRLLDGGGLAVSEYRPQDRGKPFQFLKRNRIIAALGEATVVAEAPKRSGALKTAEDAYRYGRKVFAVPGGIFTRSAEGSNELLRSGNAAAAFAPEDVLRAIGIAAGAVKRQAVPETAVTPVVALLRRGVTHFDEIAEKANLTAAETAEQLLLLEIEGVIRKSAGNEYELL